MEESFDVDFAGESKRADACTEDDFGNIEVSFNLLDRADKQNLENIMHAQNREGSNAIVQLEASVPQATLATGTSMPNQNTRHSKTERKRASDKAYRERLKNAKIEMKSNMETLTEENMLLKNENGALKGENTLLNNVLHSQAKEIGQLKCALGRLKHEHKKQDALVQTLSEILVNSDLREEIQKLRNENDLLRQIPTDGQSSQLIKENAELKHHVRVMEVQLSALCEKLITETKNLSLEPTSRFN